MSAQKIFQPDANGEVIFHAEDEKLEKTGGESKFQSRIEDHLKSSLKMVQKMGSTSCGTSG
jgi:hypothetical protein